MSFNNRHITQAKFTD